MAMGMARPRGREGSEAMADRRFGWILAWTGLVVVLAVPRPSHAQGPTIEETALISQAGITTMPGSLELAPGYAAGIERHDVRHATGARRHAAGSDRKRRRRGFRRRSPCRVARTRGPRPVRIAVPTQRIPAARHFSMARSSCPSMIGKKDRPTASRSIRRSNCSCTKTSILRAKQLEIPQARADVLTASLRANPLFYADSQLVPYGSDSVRRPDGPTQYDVNITHPIDYAHKRRYRMAYASRALEVMEAQYQNEVRLAIQNLYIAYVDVLVARETVRYLEASIKGLDEVLRVYEGLYKDKTGPRPDVDQARSDREIAVVGLLDAVEAIRQRKVVLGELLGIPPDEAERLELRGTIGDLAPPLIFQPELVQLALDQSPGCGGLSPRDRGGGSQCRATTGQPIRGRLCALPAVHLSEQRTLWQAKRHVVGDGNHGSATGLQPQPGQHRACEDQRLPVRGAVGVPGETRRDRSPTGDQGISSQP